tara:strand:- start:292 stop:1218 length:927 start_codon:yes stop_codon:yes gene_type:complete
MTDVQQDTLQNANNNDGFSDITPLSDEGSSSNLSVEDAFFGTQAEAPTEGQPSNNVVETPTQQPAPEQPIDINNDEKRYQYWQSRADKLQNELQQVQQTPQVAPPIQEPTPSQPSYEEFPPPPDRPNKPRSFNRSEAYSDPDSDSARYLDEVDDWRSEVDEYTSLKTDYQNAIVQEKIDGIEKARQAEVNKRQAFEQQHRQSEEIDQYVQGHYGLSSDQSKQFMQEMSDPKSLSMDNLVQLWRIKQGQGNVNTPAPSTPSAAFQQTQNAQQVPSPMGVMPSSGGTTSASDEDQIMDSLINNYKSKNPF